MKERKVTVTFRTGRKSFTIPMEDINDYVDLTLYSTFIRITFDDEKIADKLGVAEHFFSNEKDYSLSRLINGSIDFDTLENGDLEDHATAIESLARISARFKYEAQRLDERILLSLKRNIPSDVAEDEDE